VAAACILHLLSSAAIQPNLELKTQPKQLLGSLLLVITLPGTTLKLMKIYPVRFLRPKTTKNAYYLQMCLNKLPNECKVMCHFIVQNILKRDLI
jgi:hypothetical protein